MVKCRTVRDCVYRQIVNTLYIAVVCVRKLGGYTMKGFIFAKITCEHLMIVNIGS